MHHASAVRGDLTKHVVAVENGVAPIDACPTSHFQMSGHGLAGLVYGYRNVVCVCEVAVWRGGGIEETFQSHPGTRHATSILDSFGIGVCTSSALYQRAW